MLSTDRALGAIGEEFYLFHYLDNAGCCLHQLRRRRHTAQIHKNIRRVIDALRNTPRFSRHIRPNGVYF